MAGWALALALIQSASGQTAPVPAPTVHSEPLAGSLPPLDPPDAQGGRGIRASFGLHPRGPLFLSPMGEPFRGRDPQLQWFDQADTDHDGVLSQAEFEADAARWFKVLDREHDGEIDPDDIEYYEKFLVPEIRVGGAGGGFGGRGARPAAGGRGGGGGGRGGGGHRGGGGGYGGGRGPSGTEGGNAASPSAQQSYGRQGAARFSWFDYPEPITVADTNFNRGIDANEFQHAADERFALLNKSRAGSLKRNDLPPLPNAGGEFRRADNGRKHRGGPALPVETPPAE